MIKTTGFLLVLILALGATREIVCQVACAEPDAAHAAAACHDSGDIGGTLLQAVDDHCAGLEASPATTAVKVRTLQDQGVALATILRPVAQRLALASPTRVDLPPVFPSSPPHRTLVLRI